jgi:hypothetical protein
MDTEIRSKPWSRHLLRWISAVGSALAMALLAAPASAIIEADGFVALVPTSVFKFIVELPDDGKDGGGGWQVAKAVVPIHDTRKMNPIGLWSCNVQVGMPLRTREDSKISASKAAKVSADVAELAWKTVLPRRPPGEWTSGTFCPLYRKEMRIEFKKDNYKTLGARVDDWK